MNETDRISTGIDGLDQTLDCLRPGDNVTWQMESIGDYAFYNWTSLKSVVIPEGVINIGDFVFTKCTAIESISLPKSITNIGYSALSGTPIKIAELPNITHIASGAFSDCTSLESISFGNAITYIGEKAFAGCTALTSATFADIERTWYGYMENGE